MARRLTIGALLIVALVGCGGGSGSKPCTGGTDPLGRACTKNSDCSVTCVCEKSGGKRYRVTASLCRATSTCASATTMCVEACLISLGSWTDNFCTR